MILSRPSEERAASDLSVFEDRWEGLVWQPARSPRYGVVQIVVHGGRVTPIERRERVRFEKASASH
jgi:hypothetical protein